MSNTANGTTSQPAPSQPRRGCGAGTLTAHDGIDAMAARLAAEGGAPQALGARDLARLLKRPGTSLYLQVVAPGPASHLQLTPTSDPRATLCLAGAFCCGAAGSVREAAAAARVLVLWARTDEPGRFEVTYPAEVRRLSVVANGQLCHRGTPLGPDTGVLEIELPAV
jgi:hypothetical protein